MSEHHVNLEEELFELALQKPGSSERAAFLDGACRDSPVLRARLDVLLAAHFAAPGFMTGVPERAAPGTIATVPVPPGEAAAPTLGPFGGLRAGPFGGVRAGPLGGLRAGRYKLLEKIGEGGFGEVWMAEQREPVKRRVALKILKLGMDSRQIVARFEAERQALAMMDHPNIAKIFDADVTDTGRPYFVMELVRGVKITTYCDQNQLTTQQRLELFLKVCQAIQHAHQKGIIHRDIKPSNILVTLHDGVPVPKVIDFGIAKATHQELTDKTVFTQFQQFMGTPAYISPEQAEMSGLDIDTRADIYSLGVLLYELLVGQTPFDAKEIMKDGLDALVRIIREREPPRPSTRLNTLQGDARTTTAKRRQTEMGRLVHQLQGDLDWIVMKCLEKDRTRRYDTANGLAADILRHLNNEPVLARPPSTGYLFLKAWRRNRRAFTTAAAIVVALLVGTGVSLWQAIRATQAGNEAKKLSVLESEQRLAAQAATAQALSEKSRADAHAETTRSNLYAADMLLGQAALEAGNYGALRQSLEKHRPRAGEKDLRGFEWRLLWQQSRGDQLMTLEGHSNVVRGVAFSPDGRLLASGGADKAVIIWEARTGRKLDAWVAHNGKVNTVSFSPDGTRLATAGEDGFVKLWEWPGARLLAAIPRAGGHARFDRTQPRLFTGDGCNHKSGGEDSESAMYWLKSSNLLERVADFVALAPSFPMPADAAEIVAVGGKEWPAQILDWRGQELCRLEDSKDAMALALSPKAGQVAVATGNFGTRPESEIRIHDATTGRLVRALTNHAGRVWCLAYSADGKWLASASSDQTIRVWDASTLAEVKVFKGHGSEVWTVAFSPDGQFLASGGKDETVRVWPLVAAPPATRLPEAVVRYGVNPSPRFLSRERLFAAPATRPGGERVAVWNVLDGRVLHEFPTNELCLGEDARNRILTLNRGLPASLRYWDALDFKLLQEIPLAPTNVIRDASLSQDRKTVLLSLAGRVLLADSDTGRILQEVAFPGTGKMAAGLSHDHRTLAAMLPKLNDVRMSGVGDATNQVKLTGHRNDVYGMSFSPIEAVLATASIDNTVRLWQAPGGQALAVLEGHKAGVFDCAFSPDGRTLASASGDTTVKLWHVATQREMRTLAHERPVAICIFSPEGNYLATGTIDGQYRLWRAASAEAIAAFEEASAALKLQNDAVPVRPPVEATGATATNLPFRVVSSSLSPERRLKLQEDKLKELRRQPGADEKADTFIAMGNLAYAYHEAGWTNEAVKLQEETLAIRRKVRGSEYPSTIEAIGLLATYYDAAGRRDDALKLREEMLQLRRRVSGPAHPDTGKAMKALADSYAAAGRASDAAALLRRAAAIKAASDAAARAERIQLQEAKLKELRRQPGASGNSETFIAMGNLAYEYYAAGRTNEAVRLQEEAMDLRRKVRGPEYPSTIEAMGYMAVYYHAANRKDDALKVREEMLRLRRKVSGPEHPETRRAMQALADSYTAAGRTNEAAELRRQAAVLKAKE